MSIVNKIRRTKDNQLERYNAGRVNPLDTSFFPWVKQALGKLNLLVSRKFYDPHNVLQWALPIIGQSDSNITINPLDWYGLKFSIENLRGDLAKLDNINTYDIWSFYCGVAGAYRVGTIFKLIFPDQSTADQYYMMNPQLSEPTLTLAINGTLLKHPIAWSNGLLENGITFKKLHYLEGTQNIWLDAGDRLNIYLNLKGFISPIPKIFTTFGHISINYLTKKTRIIQAQV